MTQGRLERPLRSDGLVAARRFAAALVEEGEAMTSAERVVLTRALQHQLELAVRELGLVDLLLDEA